MDQIGYQSIQRWAGGLARDLLVVWAGRSSELPPDLASPDGLAALLEPGVVAFIGRLMTLVPEQIAGLEPVVDRFLADKAAAAGFAKAFSGDTSAVDALLNLLFAAGLQPNGRLFSYFYQTVEMMAAAVDVAARSRAARNPAASDRPDPDDARPFSAFVDPARLAISSYHVDLFERLVAGMRAQGLSHVEIGQAIAVDGQTILFTWEPAFMVGAPPEEAAGEYLGEEPPEPLAEEAPDYGPEAANGGGTAHEPATANGGAPPEPTTPPVPQPAPATAEYRLDAALPEQVTVGRVFDLAVSVMRPASPPRAIADLTRRESAAFAAVWPAGATFIQLRIQISAPDCLIHGDDSLPVRLLNNQDGPPVYFQLTPQRTGPLSVIITVYQEMDWIGSTRLRTEATPGEARGSMAVAVESHPLASAEINQVTLWRALDDGYNLDELRGLCFDLGVDYDDLAGDTRSSKARELVSYAKRHDLTARLVEKIMAGRPHLLAPA